MLARFYDMDHAWRDYRAQADAVSRLLPRGARVADLFCGSGAHAVHWSRRGLRVDGFDLSRALLKQAREKTRRVSTRPRFKRANVFQLDRHPRLRGRYDAVAVLGWTLVLDPVFKRFPRLLRVAHALLKPGGRMVFDLGLDLKVHPVSAKPLRYTLKDGWSGELRIQARPSQNGETCAYRYDWTLKSPAGKVRESRAGEVLRRVALNDVLKPIGAMRGDFMIESRRGGKNLKMILRKAGE